MVYYILPCIGNFFRRDKTMGLLRELINDFSIDNLITLLLRIAAVILCLTVHEVCHGVAAYALGDPTAKSMHRLSMNPLRHIDWLGFAALLLVGVGWAQPVPVDMRYFKNPKRGMAVTALAGPVSNILLAVLLLLAGRFIWSSAPATELWLGIFEFLLTTALLSVGLGVFNLLPIPPLDGSRIFAVVLPDRWNDTLARYERYIFPVMAVLLFSGILDGVLSVMNDWAFALVVGAASLPFQLFGL